MVNLITHRWLLSGAVLISVIALSYPHRLDAQPPTAKLLAGTARVDISPTQFPVIVSGMFNQRMADRVHLPLHSRGIVLDDGKTKLAIVVVDNLMITRELIDEAKGLASKATGIPIDRMLVSATHNHSAPSVMGALGSNSDPRYAEFLLRQIVRTIDLANKNLQPARIGWGVANAKKFTHCRRWIFRNDSGTWSGHGDPFGGATMKANMHPGYQSGRHVGPSGPADPDLSILAIQSAAGKPMGMLANLATHYKGSPIASGDFCDRFDAVFRDVVKADDSFVGIMSQGTSGDGMWMDYSKPRNDPGLEGYTKQVAELAASTWKEIKYKSDVDLAMAETTLKLKRRVPDEARLAWARKTFPHPLETLPKAQAQIYAREALFIHKVPEVEVKLQAVRIGDMGITALPNEVYAITGLKLKQQSPLAMTFNIELANGAQGYIPPPEQHELGGYTTWPARTAGLEVNAEPKIVTELVKLLEKVAGKPTKSVSDPPNSFSKAIQVAKPSAFWRLGEIAGTKVVDATARHHAEYEPGVARYLDGPTIDAESQSLPNRAAHFAGGRVRSSELDLGAKYSFECWLWNGIPNEVRAVTGYFFSRGPENNKDAVGEHLGIGGNYMAELTGKLFIFNGDQRDEVVIGKSTVPPKSWNHVVMTRDGERVQVFLNGNLEIDDKLVSTLPAGNKDIFLGGRSDNLFGLQGKLDEVAVYNRILPVEEIQTHYNSVSAELKATHIVSVTGLEVAPSSPQDSLKMHRVLPGYRIELVAAEPLVKDPVAIDWGPDGKLWVAEMADYPLGLDGKGKAGGRVRYLEDTNGDGKYDRSQLFLENISFPTGIMAWQDGVLITAAPAIIYAVDTNGDGKADKQTPLYTGFSQGNQQLRVNGLRWGLDNWIHCASGAHHGGYQKGTKVLAVTSQQRTSLGSRDFRIRPKEGLLDPQSGPSQYGRNRDDWGNWFGVQNSHPLWHYILADHDLRRNPNAISPDPRRQVVTPANPRVFPAKAPQKRFHSFEQSGRFTSACSAIIYRDELLFRRTGGDKVRLPTSHSFTCEPFHNLVQHNIIEDDGVSFKFRRDPNERDRDFFASADRWCRPVMVRTGPDGALWVVDMYRYMIEHPQWLPPQGQDELRPYFRSGEEQGRIYRILPPGLLPRAWTPVAKTNPAELIAQLESPNGWVRDAAQRKLVHSSPSTAPVEELEKLAKESASPYGRMHALCTLDGLKRLSPTTVAQALTDGHPGVRRQAVRLTSALEEPPIGALLKLVEDPSAKVRLQVAVELGNISSPRAAEGLARIMATEKDAYVVAGAMSSFNNENIDGVLAAFLKLKDPSTERLADVLKQAIAHGRADESVAALSAFFDGKDDTAQMSLLRSLLDALESKEQLNELKSIQTAVQAAVLRAEEIAFAPEASEQSRLLAISLLNRVPGARRVSLEKFLALEQPVSIRRAAVIQIIRTDKEHAAKLLLKQWSQHVPPVRSEVLIHLLSRPEWASELLNEMVSGKIKRGDIDAATRQRFGTLGPAVAKRAQELLKTPQDRIAIINKFQPALKLAGESSRGLKLFEKTCAACHRLDNVGKEFGPNLAAITNKKSEALLVAILDPNSAVEAKYASYTATTAKGRVYSGMLVSETGTQVTIRPSEGETVTLLRSDIEELKGTGKSFMPEGLEEKLSQQDIADIIHFVQRKRN
jgi:putative membrane-bound dehydrogenase-like protein